MCGFLYLGLWMELYRLWVAPLRIGFVLLKYFGQSVSQNSVSNSKKGKSETRKTNGLRMKVEIFREEKFVMYSCVCSLFSTSPLKTLSRFSMWLRD